MLMKSVWYNSKMVRIAAHVALWAIALSLPYLLDTHHGIHHEDGKRDINFQVLNFLTNILYVGPFYLNACYLTPKLFNHRRYLPFAAILILLFAFMMTAHAIIFYFIVGLEHFNIKGATNFLLPPFILSIALSMAFRLVQDKRKADQQARARQEETLKTELSFLRSQINPHFIFNVLNNIVALEQTRSAELTPTILKLSSLMQYMLYETDEEQVPLGKELEYLVSYIDLQRQRFGEKIPVTVDLDEPAGFYEIEPMLLIPFVENAFKHGVGRIQDAAIHIWLRVDKGILYFSVRNRFDPESKEEKDRTSGIGLSNVSRRLNLLYGDQQTLQITKADNWFTISLELKLH